VRVLPKHELLTTPAELGQVVLAQRALLVNCLVRNLRSDECGRR
jgi:hypothetical protein